MAEKPKFEIMSNAEYRAREGLSSSDIKRMMKSRTVAIRAWT